MSITNKFTSRKASMLKKSGLAESYSDIAVLSFLVGSATGNSNPNFVNNAIKTDKSLSSVLSENMFKTGLNKNFPIFELLGTAKSLGDLQKYAMSKFMGVTKKNLAVSEELVHTLWTGVASLTTLQPLPESINYFAQMGAKYTSIWEIFLNEMDDTDQNVRENAIFTLAKNIIGACKSQIDSQSRGYKQNVARDIRPKGLTVKEKRGFLSDFLTLENKENASVYLPSDTLKQFLYKGRQMLVNKASWMSNFELDTVIPELTKAFQEYLTSLTDLDMSFPKTMQGVAEKIISNLHQMSTISETRFLKQWATELLRQGKIIETKGTIDIFGKQYEIKKYMPKQRMYTVDELGERVSPNTEISQQEIDWKIEQHYDISAQITMLLQVLLDKLPKNMVINYIDYKYGKLGQETTEFLDSVAQDDMLFAVDPESLNDEKLWGMLNNSSVDELLELVSFGYGSANFSKGVYRRAVLTWLLTLCMVRNANLLSQVKRLPAMQEKVQTDTGSTYHVWELFDFSLAGLTREKELSTIGGMLSTGYKIFKNWLNLSDEDSLVRPDHASTDSLLENFVEKLGKMYLKNARKTKVDFDLPIGHQQFSLAWIALKADMIKDMKYFASVDLEAKNVQKSDAQLYSELFEEKTDKIAEIFNKMMTNVELAKDERSHYYGKPRNRSVLAKQEQSNLNRLANLRSQLRNLR
jgi:hypothetical protein